MACPYFYPTERFGENLWPHPPRLPLGDGFAGICMADPGRDFHPAAATLQECCNLGYACNHCGRFPQSAGADAVRFSISGEDEGIIKIYYVLEKDHRPHEHGPLDYDADQRALAAPPPNRILRRQAEAYAESYLRRKGRRPPFA